MSASDLSDVAWRKSSHSNGTGGNCVEIAAIWHKSSYSNGAGGACVEVASVAPAVAVRDSKNPAGPVLRFVSTDWHAFIGGVKDGAFDLT